MIEDEEGMLKRMMMIGKGQEETMIEKDRDGMIPQSWIETSQTGTCAVNDISGRSQRTAAIDEAEISIDNGGTGEDPESSASGNEAGLGHRGAAEIGSI
jgi:hypothetical protein